MEKLIYATKSVFYSDGNYDQLKQCTQFSPKRALQIRKTYKDKLKCVISHYTVVEALAIIIIYAKLTKQNYIMLIKGAKQRNSDI